MGKKVRIRWGRLILVGTVVLTLLAVPAAFWLLRSGLDQQLLTKALSDAAGMEVSFSSYSLGWTGKATLNDLKVRVGEEQLLQAEGLTASFSWLSLLKREPEVSGLRLLKPDLTLSEASLDELRRRPKGEGTELAVDFEKAKVSYQHGERSLSLQDLNGRYSEGLVEVRQSQGFEGTISWDDKTHHYKISRLPLELLGRLAERSLPEGTAELDLVQQGKRFEGTVEVDSALFAAKSGIALQLGDSMVAGVLTADKWSAAQYSFGQSKVPFEWDGSELKLTAATVVMDPGGTIKVDGKLSAKVADLSLTREKVTLNLRGLKPPFALKATWNGTSVLSGSLRPDPWTLQVSNLNGGFLMRQAELGGVGFDFTGKLAWEDGLTGHLKSSGGTLRGTEIGQTELSLEANTSGNIKAAGSCVVAKQPFQISAERQGQSWQLAASGNELPVSLLKPGIGGTIDLSAKAIYPGGKSNFDFTYSGSQEIPPVTGHGALEGDSLVFSALRLSSLKPPVTATGRYGIKSGSLDFTAELSGHRAKTLWAASPVSGALYGKAKLGGTGSKPAPSFAGEIRETQWQGTSLGTVAVTVKDGQMKAELPSFSLASVKQLKPYLKGVGSVTLTGLPPQMRIALNFPKVSFKDYELGTVKAHMKVKGESLVIESLELPAATLQGTVSANKLALEGQVRQLQLGKLPMPVKVSGTANGKVSVSGPPKAPSGTFLGTVDDLVYEQNKFGTLPVEAKYGTERITVKTSGLVVEKLPALARALPALKGSLDVSLEAFGDPTVEMTLSKGSYAGTSLPPISTVLVWGKEAVNIKRLTMGGKTPLSMAGSFVPTSGKFELVSSLNKIELGPYLALLPQRPPLNGILSGRLKLTGDRKSAEVDFKGAGRGIVVSDVALGSIEQLNLSATGEGDFMLQADGLAASGIQPLKGLYPNLRGSVSFRASRDKDAPDLALAGNLLESNLPDLSFRGSWLGTTLELKSLTAATNPPVTMTGTVKDGNLNVEAQLSGQSLAQLMPLGGAAPPSEVAANLGGSLRLTGPMKSPTASLLGPVHNMVYRTSQLGSGHLRLTVTDRLQGELNLDQPYEATLADAAPGSVTQVPLISDVLKRAMKARISAVKISGTPGDPVVTPVVVGVGIAQGLGLPEQVKIPDMQDVQTQLPGVLEQQTGIKIPDLNNGGAKINIPGTGQSIKIKL